MSTDNKRFLIIPDNENIADSIALAEKYNMGFEYNDFFMPDVLDDDAECMVLTYDYKKFRLPDYCTLHGAFFDVIVCSVDKRIRKISDFRVKQSIAAAEKIGAKAVIFHTNYNPFLNSPKYVEDWIMQNTEYWGNILQKYPDMNIYLENMFDTSPEIIARLAENLSVNSNFGVCLDYAHASLTSVPVRTWWEMLSPYVRHMHINDNDLISDLHLAAGDGLINWDEFYNLYELFADDPTILIETSSLENQKKTIDKFVSDGFIHDPRI